MKRSCSHIELCILFGNNKYCTTPFEVLSHHNSIAVYTVYKSFILVISSDVLLNYMYKTNFKSWKACSKFEVNYFTYHFRNQLEAKSLIICVWYTVFFLLYNATLCNSPTYFWAKNIYGAWRLLDLEVRQQKGDL